MSKEQLYKKVWVLESCEEMGEGRKMYKYHAKVPGRNRNCNLYYLNKPMKILPDANASKTFNTEEEAEAFVIESDIERCWHPTEVFIAIKL